MNVPNNAYDPSHMHTEAEQTSRMCMIEILQDRSRSIPERLLKLRRFLRGCDDAADTNDGLSGYDGVRGLGILLPMLRVLAERHDSIRDCGESAVGYFESDTGMKYESAKSDFEISYPKWQILAEHLLVNHVFFSRFPVTDRKLDADDMWKALVLMYALIRCTALGCTEGKMKESTLVDAIAACFRMIDHTEFEPYAVLLMKKFGADDDASIADLLCI